MKWLYLLFILPTGLISAEPFVRYVDSITYHSQGGDLVASVTLSDGSKWKWIADPYNEHLLQKWQAGDEIVIRVLNRPGFVLQNLRKPHYVPTVSLGFDSYALFPTIEACGPCSIELSDGSSWKLIYDFNRRTIYHWNRGDQIIQVRGSPGNFALINLDIPHDNRFRTERYMEVAPNDADTPFCDTLLSNQPS